MTQQIIVRPLGIVTQPNKIGGIPEGALVQADRAYMRDPGTIAAANAWVVTQSNITNTSVAYLIVVGANVLWVQRDATPDSWRYHWVVQATGSILYTINLGTNIVYGAAYVDPGGRWASFSARSRTFLMCNRGVLVWDFEAPSTLAEASARAAGLTPPVLYNYTRLTTEVGTAIAPFKHCHAVAVRRRRKADGYELVSAPTAALQVTGDDAGSLVRNIQFFIYAGTDNAAGDVFEIYRTRQQPIVLGGGGTNTGADYYLSTTYVLPAPTGGFITVIDRCPDDSLGEALYTNQAISGAAASALPPPSARCAASFRGYAFYGNRTDAAQIQFRPPAFWGFMSTSATAPLLAGARKSGIGIRYFDGTTATGNPTITGISAADIVGLVVGQLMFTSGFASTPSYVVSVTATTVTMDTNALATGTSTYGLQDVIEVTSNGLGPAKIGAGSAAGFVSSSALQSRGVYMMCLSNVLPSLAAPGIFPSSVPATDVTLSKLLTFGLPSAADNISIRATNGDNFVPRLPKLETNETAQTATPTVVPNGIAWSEENQPENVPSPNVAFVGKGEIYTCYSTRDALWFFCSDGLWRLSGTGGDVASGYDWRVDPVDPSLIISGPQAGCVFRDKIYACTSRGFVSIDSSGAVVELSNGRLDDVFASPDWSTPTYGTATGIYVTAKVDQGEIWIRMPASGDGGRVWIYNTYTDAFTQDICVITGNTAATTHMAYMPTTQAMLAATQLTATSASLIKNQAAVPASMVLKFQPMFASSPFAMRHWQRLSVAYEATVATDLTASVNNLGVIATRALAGTDPSEHARTSFGIPRNSPSTSNNISLGMSTSASVGPAGVVKLQGFAIDYMDHTDQRKDR